MRISINQATRTFFWIILFSIKLVAPCYAGYIIKPSTSKSQSIDNATDAIAIDSPEVHQTFFERINRLRHKKDSAHAVKSVHKKSGIFGRLSLYLGMLSFIFFIVAVSTLTLWATEIWLDSAFFAVILGLIGMHKRKKKGMAIAGILLGLLQFAILGLLISIGAALITALPYIGFLIFILH